MKMNSQNPGQTCRRSCRKIRDRTRRQGQAGAALVELALIIPLLLLMTVITTEFGRAILHYNLITKSTRDAVRYLSVQTPNTHVDEARNLIVYGTTVATDQALVPGLTLANVPATNITWQTAGAGPLINTVRVSVTGYCFRPLFASVFGVSFGSVACDGATGIPYSAISATMRAQL